MDPLTHAASGAVAMLALPRRPLTRWAVPLAALVTASPDLDIFFARSPLDFLLLHRGISHSFFAAPVFGLLLALCCFPLWRRSTAQAWSLLKVWGLTTALICLHIWLDVVTTYGTMAFLPFSAERVRLNAVFIIDLLVTLPMLWAIWRWRQKPWLMRLTLAWIFLYPVTGIVLNHWHTGQTEARLHAEGRAVHSVTVLPDAFAPLFWRVLYAEQTADGTLVRQESLDALGRLRPSPSSTTDGTAPAPAATALPAESIECFSKQSLVCRAFMDFSLLPVQASLPGKDLPTPSRSQDPATANSGTAPAAPTYVLSYDLRFGSGLRLVRKLMALRPHADIPFRLMLELDPQGRILRERMVFPDSRRDSGWQAPQPPVSPEAQAFSHWLVGLP